MGGVLAALGAVLAYWTSTATKREYVFGGVYADVPAFDSSITAIMLGVLVIGIVIIVYSMVTQPVRSPPSMEERQARFDESLVAWQAVLSWAHVPLAIIAGVVIIVMGMFVGDLYGMTIMLSGVTISVIALATMLERRYRRVFGVLLIIASILPLLYFGALSSVIGPVLGVIGGILMLSVPAEQEHVSEHA